jgi:hypothetical protein
MVRRLRSFVGAHARELMLLLSALGRSKGAPTVLILPSHGPESGASNLRGYLIADELRLLGWNAYACHSNLGLRQRRRAIWSIRPDVILMQMARHPLNRPRLYGDVPVVFDIDDADYVDPQQRDHVIEALESSVAVIAGSRAVARFCRTYNDTVEVVWTGTPVSSERPRPQSERPPVVAWTALFPSRCPAEADFLIDVLRTLMTRTREFKFVLYCDDGSAEFRAFADRFRALGVDVETRPLIADYAQFLASLEDIAVGLAPLIDLDGFSGGKSFGKVLAYMDRGVPVLTHGVVDHPLFFESGVNGWMADGRCDWAEAIARLLTDADERQRLADAARAHLQRRLSTREAAMRIDGVLRGVIEDRECVAAQQGGAQVHGAAA